MDLVYVGSTSNIGKRGIQNSEYGMIVTGFTQRWENPKEYNTDSDGTPIGFWTSHQRFSTITIEGKVNTDWQHIDLVTGTWGSNALNDGMIGYNGTDGVVLVTDAGAATDPLHNGGHVCPTAGGTAVSGVTATWNTYWKAHASGGPEGNGTYGLTWCVPLFFANATAGFGVGAPGEGAFYLDDIEVVQSEGQPVTFRATATTYPGVQHPRS